MPLPDWSVRLHDQGIRFRAKQQNGMTEPEPTSLWQIRFLASAYKAHFLLYTDAKETGYPENTWHFRFRHYKNKKKEKADTIRKKECVLMKKRYSIGFFAAFFLIISLLAIGYQLSYQYRMDKQEAKTVEEENTQFISTKGETTKNEGYYLKELHGYVAVYLSDGETLYELTEISCSSLPKEVQEAVRTGKYVETTRELYGFLENYSS